MKVPTISVGERVVFEAERLAGAAGARRLRVLRHGTVLLYDTLNTRNGLVLGKTAGRHASQEFVAFLAELVASQSRRKSIHLIADNLSAHKTMRVE